MKALEESLLKIHDKLDQIQKDISEIKVVDAVQTQQLSEHMRRTDLLEKALKPLGSHVQRVQGALKLLASTAVLLSLVELLRKVIH